MGELPPPGTPGLEAAGLGSTGFQHWADVDGLEEARRARPRERFYTCASQPQAYAHSGHPPQMKLTQEQAQEQAHAPMQLVAYSNGIQAQAHAHAQQIRQCAAGGEWVGSSVAQLATRARMQLSPFGYGFAAARGEGGLGAAGLGGGGDDAYAQPQVRALPPLTAGLPSPFGVGPLSLGTTAQPLYFTTQPLAHAHAHALAFAHAQVQMRVQMQAQLQAQLQPGV
ncbi:hypothetical protein T492DRAFT_854930 [Pavlovales sp. CCMP2436]|nr:hypothetical protein T492DRAFT_854930 [Pavlovales sp. CCMP2436]